MALLTVRDETGKCAAPCIGAQSATDAGLVQLMGRAEGLPTPLIYRKGWALLGYLAVESNRLHPRCALAALLWPTLSETSALTNLRQVLSNLNRYCVTALGEGVLQIERNAVSLMRGDALLFDIDQLVQQPCKVAHLLSEQPSFLDGMEDLAGSDFHAWLETTRQDLDAKLTRAAEQCCDELLETQQWEGAAAMARALGQHDPWNEAHAQRIMRAHAGRGMRAAAMKAYENFEALLQTELGVRPGPKTRELLESIGGLRRSNAQMLAPVVA